MLLDQCLTVRPVCTIDATYLTLPPIIIEVRNHPKWKETIILEIRAPFSTGCHGLWEVSGRLTKRHHILVWDLLAKNPITKPTESIGTFTLFCSGTCATSADDGFIGGNTGHCLIGSSWGGRREMIENQPQLSDWFGEDIHLNMGVSLNGGTPKSSILIWFSIINHPFWGTPIFRNTHNMFILKTGEVCGIH